MTEIERAFYHISSLILALSLVGNLLLLLRLAHHSPHGQPLCILVQHPGHRLFTVKHQKWAVLLNVNLLCLVLRFLFFAGADGLSCFIQLHWVEALGLLPKPGILVQGSVQLGGIFLFLFFQPFQALLHGGDVFGKFIGGIFLGICQRRQKQIFLRTQFLQILCQCRNLSRQFPVPEYMNRRERLFLGKQTAALLRLIPNVLCKLIVLCEGRAQRIQRSVQALPFRGSIF